MPSNNRAETKDAMSFVSALFCDFSNKENGYKLNLSCKKEKKSLDKCLKMEYNVKVEKVNS